MSDEEGQELVTKPFKFVTDRPDTTPLIRERRNDQLEQLDQLQRRRLRAARGFGNSFPGFFSRNVAGGPAVGYVANFECFCAGTDARFPNVNQTKHCWQNYVDYHKCIIAKGEDFAPCRQFWLAYRSLCPSGWYQRWDEQREAGNFPVKLDA
ncbi:cytochrome c oxidase subunit 6b [Trichoderma gamsii]|uniref:Cytochrome c oxidase subunit 12, mitochondrial n=1 Tax=Trichoderma gamsii TaxID=398673 RepID=A0A2P4ZNT2_9HYPO|nr:cytochrome c oxidase subunit 6b [Trichoderma gamsii]PON25959.1 cytochrome c oxidase subunit 6b [Trichoderma gamsii]